MATSEQILNSIRDTINNLVEKYKAQSTAPETTPSDLKEIDKELGDCLNLLLSVDSSLTNFNFEDSKTLLESLAIKETNIDNLLAIESTINEMITKFDNGLFKGDKGDTGEPFTYDMFTEAQLALLKGIQGDKGDKGDSFTFDDFTNEQLETLKGATGSQGIQGEKGLRGATGSSLTFDMLTNEQKEQLRGSTGSQGIQGERGLRGATGSSLTFDMLTNEQKEQLRGATGSTGLSAYDIYIEIGGTGTKEDFINSLKSIVSDTGWIDLKPYLSSGWLEFSTAYPIRCKRVDNFVFFEGLVKGGSSNLIFSNLPSEVVPSATIFLPALATSSASTKSYSSITTEATFTVNEYDTYFTSINTFYVL